MSLFDVAFERSMGNEGGFQKDPGDRGNWTSGKIGVGELKGTKYGISAMSYPDVDIENLTLEEAKAIYKKDWWDALHMVSFGPGLSFQMFDAALHHGMGNASRMLQRAVGVKDDGILGPQSKAAVLRMSSYDLCFLFLAERLEFMTNLSNAMWTTNGRGFSRRIAANLRYAAKDL